MSKGPQNLASWALAWLTPISSTNAQHFYEDPIIDFEATKIYHSSVQYTLNPTQIEIEPEKLQTFNLFFSQNKKSYLTMALHGCDGCHVQCCQPAAMYDLYVAGN